MKIPRRLSRLVGRFGRCAAGVLALCWCTSAVAGEGGDKNLVVAPVREPAGRPVPKKQLYMFTSASAIPQPIERVASPIPTTAIPVTVYGNRLGR